MRCGRGADTLTGFGGDDRLRAGKGNDVVNGGAGDDRIVGGQGDDTLTGGEGSDTFWYGLAGSGHDLITDFAMGTDRIDLKAFELTWAELMAAASDDGNGNTIITLAHPSNPAKDGSITLTGVEVSDLTADAFLL